MPAGLHCRFSAVKISLDKRGPVAYNDNNKNITANL